MIRVTLRALRLRGFGPFECVTARFEAGMCVLVRPNEWGKSTLVQGLQAALFGLGGGARGTGARGAMTVRQRWRGQGMTGPFDALVLLESGGRLFQFYREFESDRVILRSRPATVALPDDAFEVPRSMRVPGDGEWTQHFAGVHRPSGGRGPHPFEQWLRRVVGLSSQELFESTFCFTRRLPEADRIDAAVQRVLVGPGSEGLEEALRRLQTRARRLTSRPQRWGVPAAPARRPGPAEELAGEIEALARGLDVALARVDVDVGSVGPKAPAGLQEASALRERMRELSSREGELETRLEQTRLQAEELRRRLDVEFGALASRPDLDELPSRVGRLRACRAELERVEGQLAELREAERQARAELARMADWSRRGPRPSAEIPEFRQLASRLAQAWGRLEALYRERDGILNRLATDYRCFEEAAPEAISALRRARERREMLHRQLASIDGQIERIGAALEQLSADAATLEEAFADVVQLESRLRRAGGPDLLEFLGECERWVSWRRSTTQAIQRLAALGARRRAALRRRQLLGMAGRATLGLLAGVLAFVYAEGADPIRLWQAPWPPRAAAAALGGAWLLAVVGGRGVARRARALSAGLHELRGLMPGTGGHGGTGEGRAEAQGRWDLEALAALLERARVYRIRMGRLVRREAALKEQGISLEAADALRARRQRVEGSLAELARLTQPFLSRFGDGAPAALGAWETLRRRLRAVDQEIRRLLQALEVEPAAGDPGVPPWASVVRAPLGPAAQRLAEWLLVAAPVGGRVARVEQLAVLSGLAELAKALGERFWDAVEEEARRFERVTARLDEIHRELGELEAPGPDGLSRRQRLEQEAAQLGALVAPFDERTDEQWLADQVEACRRLESQLDAALRQAAELADALAACREEGSRCQARLEELAQARCPPSQPQGLGAEGDGEVWQATEHLAQREGRLPRLNLAVAEQELRRLRGQLAQVEEELGAVAEAYRTLNEAAAAFYGEFRRRLEERAGDYFSRLSGRPGRRVIVDERFRVRVAEPDGRRHEPQRLSEGARDQLSIALRLAMAAMVDDRLRLPLIFDDPFVHCDATRLENLRQTLTQLAGDFQVVVLTHRPELAGWGRAVQVDGA